MGVHRLLLYSQECPHAIGQSLYHGIQDDLRRERDVVERTIRSLRIDGAHIDLKYSDERLSTDSVRVLSTSATFSLDCTTRPIMMENPRDGVSFAEQEFDQARRLENRNSFSSNNSRIQTGKPTESAFIERILQEGDKNLHSFDSTAWRSWRSY